MIYTAEAVWLALAEEKARLAEEKARLAEEKAEEMARLAEELKFIFAKTEIAAAKGEQMQGRCRGYRAAQIPNPQRLGLRTFDRAEEAARAYDDPELRFAMPFFPRAEHCIKGGKAEAPAASIVATAAPHHAHDYQIVFVADGGPMIGDDVKFTVAASAKGGTEIKIGSHVMLVPKCLSVHHPLAQMLLFSRNMFGDTFACLKSMAPKSIFDMAKRLRSSASPNVCGADWISARPKSESPKLRTDSEFNTGKSFGSRNELAENESHPRGTDSCSKDDYLQATQRCVHMINGAEGIADQPMHDVFLIDSAAALNCTGDRNLLSEYAEYKELDESITGASRTVMPILGIGSICNGRFQVKNVKHMPSLNGPNINKTIFSVRELVKLGYSVHFSGAHCSVVDNRKLTWSRKTWTWTHEVVGEAHLEHGQFMVDYLRISADRTPATTSERATLAASFWKAAASGWTRMTGLITHQKAGARRPPV